MEKILLLEPDKEQAELFTAWLKGEGYDVNSLDSLQEVQASVSEDRFDILLMDIDEPEITEPSLKLVQTLKADPRFADLPIVTLAYGKDVKKIAYTIEAGADNFVLKPFEVDSFLRCLEAIFKEIELKKQGKKVLDLNYINYLIALAGEAEREDFFVLAPIIFNKLIIEKINTILGSPIITQMIKRVNEIIGADYEFMKSAEFSGNRLSLDGVDKASRDIPGGKLTTAFRDYVYGFLQLVNTLTSDILMERGAE